MGDPLRERQSLKGLSENRQVIEIAEKIAIFDRLAESVENDLSALSAEERPPDWRAREVRGQLTFGNLMDRQGMPVMHAALRALVPAICQRCLETFDWPLEISVDLLFAVADKETEHDEVSSTFERWEVPGDAVSLIDIVDETLVMALPLSMMHRDNERCTRVNPVAPQQDRNSPFASLRSMLDDER